jgi:hypothetical protein
VTHKVDDTKTTDGYIKRVITNRKTGKKTTLNFGNAAGLRWAMAYAQQEISHG